MMVSCPGVGEWSFPRPDVARSWADLVLPRGALWCDEEEVWLNELSFVVAIADTVLYHKCTSWKTVAVVKQGDVLMVVGLPKAYEGYDLVRVCGGGAVQAAFVEFRSLSCGETINPKLVVKEFEKESAKQVHAAMRWGVRSGARRGRSAIGGGWCSRYTRREGEVGRSCTSLGCMEISLDVTKRSERKFAWRRAAWDEDWRKVNEQFRASLRWMDMAVVQAKFALTSKCAKSAGGRGEAGGLYGDGVHAEDTSENLCSREVYVEDVELVEPVSMVVSEVSLYQQVQGLHVDPTVDAESDDFEEAPLSDVLAACPGVGECGVSSRVLLTAADAEHMLRISRSSGKSIPHRGEVECADVDRSEFNFIHPLLVVLLMFRERTTSTS